MSPGAVIIQQAMIEAATTALRSRYGSMCHTIDVTPIDTMNGTVMVQGALVLDVRAAMNATLVREYRIKEALDTVARTPTFNRHAHSMHVLVVREPLFAEMDFNATKAMDDVVRSRLHPLMLEMCAVLRAAEDSVPGSRTASTPSPNKPSRASLRRASGRERAAQPGGNSSCL